jgi:hypothetical protein
LNGIAELGGKEGVKGFIKAVGKTRADVLLAVLSKLIPRTQLSAMEDAIESGPVEYTDVTVVGVPPGARIDPYTDEIIYPDGVRVVAAPFAPFVATPEIAELEPAARIKQLERRVAELERRNAYLERMLDPSRSQPALPGSKPQLIVDNNGETPDVA